MQLLKSNWYILLLFFLILSISSNCGLNASGNRSRADSLFLRTENLSVTYNLLKPDTKFFLPYVLEEISGLTYKKGDFVMAVDDESGRIFEYDLNKRDIVHSIKFHSPDDFEGVELVRDTLYVLKSDGDVFAFAYTDEKSTTPVKYENKLGSKNDTEGLGYDPVHHRLLIACKEKGGIGDNEIKGRTIYGFDLKTKKLIEEPVAIISYEDLKVFWEASGDYAIELGRIKFKPSAIAVHPLDGTTYVLASNGKLLIILNVKGQVIGSYPIYPILLGQPEGICFSEEGDLYISSEGEGDRGYILKFTIHSR